MVLLVVLAVGGGGTLARDSIVAAWPPAAKFYDLIGLPVETLGAGLEIRERPAKWEADDGDRVLVVEGEVANTSTQARPVPLMRVSLHNAERELQHWTFVAAGNRLLPGESVPFRARLKNPVEGATELMITFTEGDG